MSLPCQYFMFKLLSRIVCLLPYPCLTPLAKILGRLYYRFAKRQRILALSQIKKYLGLTEAEAEAAIRSSFVKLGKTFLEFLYMPNLTPELIEKYITIENRHYLDQAAAEGKGIIFVSGHIGNWEWFGAVVAMWGIPVAHIVKRQPNEQHTRLLNEYRQMFGIETYASGTNEIVGAARALKRGRLLSFLSDQDAGKDGIFVEFLGKMASTHIGPAVFAEKFKAPILSGFIVRKPSGGHLITFGPPIHFEDTGNLNEDIRRTTEKITEIIEDTVRTYPDEWMWFKKRWDTPYEDSKDK